jgi:hypothetical protein
MNFFSRSSEEAKRYLLSDVKMTVLEIATHARSFERNMGSVLVEYNSLGGSIKPWLPDSDWLPVAGSLPAKIFYNILASLGVRITNTGRVDERFKLKCAALERILEKVEQESLLQEFKTLKISAPAVHKIYHETALLDTYSIAMLRLFILTIIRTEGREESSPDTHADEIVRPYKRAVKFILQRSINRSARLREEEGAVDILSAPDAPDVDELEIFHLFWLTDENE